MTITNHPTIQRSLPLAIGLAALLLCPAPARAQWVNGTYYLFNSNTGTALGTAANYDGATVQTSIWIGATAQQWQIGNFDADISDPGVYSIQSDSTYRFLDVIGHLLSGYAPAMQYHQLYFDTAYKYWIQRWRIATMKTQNGTKYFQIYNRAMGQCLTDAGQVGVGGAVLVWPCGAGPGQTTQVTDPATNRAMNFPLSQLWTTWNPITGRQFPE